MDKLKVIAKDMGRKTLRLVLWFLAIIALVVIPFIFNELLGENVALVVMLLETVGVIAFAIYWAKKHPKPVLEKVEPVESGGGGKAFVGIFIFFIVMGILGNDDEVSTSTNNTPSNSAVAGEEFNPADYFTDSTQKTFYTNDTANIRSCESTTCPVIGQSDMNMPISLNYASPSEMPEWVSVGFSQGGVAKDGFMHKSVLSTTVTVPATSYSSYGSNYHVDDRYKYNSRTGYSGDYSYDYSVEGYGDTGYAYGDVEMNGKYGEGYIYNEDGEEVYVETEWTDNGVMEAYDEYGNWYEFEVY